MVTLLVRMRKISCGLAKRQEQLNYPINKYYLDHSIIIIQYTERHYSYIPGMIASLSQLI